MSTKERCQQEARLADLFSRQGEANDCKDREGADALFMQIWEVLDAGGQGSH